MTRSAIKTIQVRAQDLMPDDVVLYAAGKNVLWQVVDAIRFTDEAAMVSWRNRKVTPRRYGKFDLVTIQKEVPA